MLLQVSLEHEMSEIIQEQETPNEFDDVPLSTNLTTTKLKIDEEE